MATNLILKDDIDSVDFVSSTYQLLDESLSVGFPKTKTINHSPSYYSGRDIIGMTYGTRRVRFAFLVTGATDSACDINVGKISRMLIRNSSPLYINGGQYTNRLTGEVDNDTGDSGLRLRVNFNNSVSSIGKEEIDSGGTQVTENTDGYATMKIVSGDLEVQRGLFTTLRVKHDLSGIKYFRECQLTLECEPFFLGESRVVVTDDDINTALTSAGLGTGAKASSVPYPYNLNSGYDNSYNKYTIPAADIPGDAPALIRLAMKPINEAAQSAMVFARDAGISILNNPSSPVQLSGTAVDNIYAYGYLTAVGNYTYRVQTQAVGTYGQFRISDDAGSTWSTYANIVPGQSHQIPGHQAWVVFPNDDESSYNQAGLWEFVSHQSYIPGGGTYNYTSMIDSLFNGSAGQEIDQIRFIVPPGCNSKYMVLANVTAQGRHEYRMMVRYSAPGSLVWDYTLDTQYDWTTMGNRAYNDCIVNLGVIDLGKGMPASSHPNSVISGQIKILTRNLQYQSTPTGTIEVRNIWLVPVQDEGMMFAAWAFDGPGSMIFSNYNPTMPYRANTLKTWYDPYTGVYQNFAHAAVPLDGTMAGTIPTLIPGVDNTIMLLSLGTGVTLPDWRAVDMLPTNAKENKFYLAIRPRYLSNPG